MTKYRWQDWIMTVVGLWLIASPWALPALHVETAPQDNMMWNAVISGAVLTLMGIAALLQRAPWEEWADLVIAAWLFASPWVLGYTAHTGASWNTWICAAFIFALAGSEVVQRQSERAM